jgi:hypothetical protein
VTKPHKDLVAIITRLEALYPGDTDAVVERLMAIVAYSITRKLLDPETLAALRADALQWPESIQKLLSTAATEGGAL